MLGLLTLPFSFDFEMSVGHPVLTSNACVCVCVCASAFPLHQTISHYTWLYDNRKSFLSLQILSNTIALCMQTNSWFCIISYNSFNEWKRNTLPSTSLLTRNYVELIRCHRNYIGFLLTQLEVKVFPKTLSKTWFFVFFFSLSLVNSLHQMNCTLFSTLIWCNQI